MKKTTKTLFIIFFVTFLIKTILAYFIKSPSVFADEYIYLKVAQGFFENFSFYFHEEIASPYPPLYTLIMSVTYIFRNISFIYPTIKIINSFISSLIVFPIFFIAKDFLNKKDAFAITILISFISLILVFPIFVMSENLFYFLSILFVYLLYNSFKSNSSKFFILSGIVLGLAFLTRILAVALIPAAIITCFFVFKKTKVKFTNIIYHYIASLVTVFPWILRNLKLYGFKISSLFGAYSGSNLAALGSSNIFIPFLNWTVLYFGYALLASGILFGIYFLSGIKSKNKKLSLISIISSIIIFFSVILAANHSARSGPSRYASLFSFFTGRPLGRYVGVAIILLILLGYIIYKKRLFNNKSLKYATITSSIILLWSTQFIFTALFPLNNQSLTYLGLFQLGMQKLFLNTFSTIPKFSLPIFITTALILFIIPWFFYTLRKTKIPYILIISLLIINSIAAYGVVYWNANNNWYNDERSEIGRFIDKNIDKNSVILIDSKFEGQTDRRDPYPLYQQHKQGPKNSLLAFWFTNKVIFDNPVNNKNFDYLVTRDKYNLELIKKTKNGIYLYKNTIKGKNEKDYCNNTSI